MWIEIRLLQRDLLRHLFRECAQCCRLISIEIITIVRLYGIIDVCFITLEESVLLINVTNKIVILQKNIESLTQCFSVDYAYRIDIEFGFQKSFTVWLKHEKRMVNISHNHSPHSCDQSKENNENKTLFGSKYPPWSSNIAYKSIFALMISAYKCNFSSSFFSGQ